MTSHRNVPLILTYSVCCNLVFLLPIIIPYSKYIGLSFQEFLLTEAIFAAIVLFAEVPSGWLSDIWKRRTTLIISTFFAVIGYSFLLNADSFWIFALGQAIIGIAVSLNSGTINALLYDTLLQDERVGEYRKLEGKRHAYTLYAVAFASIIGAAVYQIDEKLPVALEIIALIIAMISISFIIEPKRQMKSIERHMFYDMMQTMKYALSGHREVAGIIFISMIAFCTTKLMLWTQQPYYMATGIGVEWFGIILAGLYLLSGFAGQWGHLLDHKVSHRFVLGFTIMLLAISCIGLAVFQNPIAGIGFFLMGTMVYGAVRPRVDSAINDCVGSERRASVLSTAALMVNVMFIPSSIVVGMIDSAVNIFAAQIYIGIQVLVLGAIGFILWRQSDVRARGES